MSGTPRHWRKPECTILSPRERQVLALIAEGHTYKSASAIMYISWSTVRITAYHAYAKLGVHNAAAAVAKAIRTGQLPMDALPETNPPNRRAA